jgi:putative membrane protein
MLEDLGSARCSEARASKTRRRYAACLAVAFSVVWMGSAWKARYPADWLLENALVFLAVPLLVLGWRRSPLSRASYTAVFVFLCLHEIGAHYTYSEVPYDEWVGAISGRTLSEITGWQRNHFDRVVHFLYGALLVLPLREILARANRLEGWWSYALPVAFTMSTSVAYELTEWAAALAFGRDLGMAYLGAQGDVWDGQKDMALASLGAALTMLAAVLWDRDRRQH